jgi:hypothetical protein
LALHGPRFFDALSPGLSRHRTRPFEHLSRNDQVGCRETFGELPVDRLDEILGPLDLATVDPDAREFQTRAQFV